MTRSIAQRRAARGELEEAGSAHDRLAFRSAVGVGLDSAEAVLCH